jgi:hypothetical protein
MSTDPEWENRPAGSLGGDEATRAAAAHLILQLSMPPELRVRLPGVGEVDLRPRFLDRAAARAWWQDSRPGCEAVALECAGQSGVFFVEHGLALSVVNAVLGLATPPLGGPLSRIERGVLAGTLATMFAELGLAPGLRLGEDLDTGSGAGASIVGVTLDLSGRRGQAWLAASDEFHVRLWSSREPGKSAFATRLELATTTVAEAELAGAGPGDRVVFDETAALSPDDAWPVRVRREGISFPAWWLANGTVVAAGCPTADAVTCPDRPASIHHTMEPAALAPGTVAVIAACTGPALDPARPAPLVIPRGGPVLVEAESRGWAYGEITALDGALAVTITRTLTGSRTGSRTRRP